MNHFNVVLKAVLVFSCALVKIFFAFIKAINNLLKWRNAGVAT